jgi:hypothetical protein
VEDSHGNYGLGSLIEFRFNAPPGTPYPSITIHIIGTTQQRLMGVPTSDVGYTSATTGRGDHEVHKGHVVSFGGGGGRKNLQCVQNYRTSEYLNP